MENIRLAFQGIWGHKMRSVLTMLGIIIGIASIITIVSTIKGTRNHQQLEEVKKQKNEVEPLLYTIHKNELKIDQRPKCKS